MKEIDMGTFHVGALIENHTDRKKSFRISKLLVDTGSEHTWLPESFLDKIDVKRRTVQHDSEKVKAVSLAIGRRRQFL